MDKQTYAWFTVEVEKVGPDNWESQANLELKLSFTFRPLFQGEIRILWEANYQSQEGDGEVKHDGKKMIHLACRCRTKMLHLKAQEVGEREQEREKATNPPLRALNSSPIQIIL